MVASQSAIGKKTVFHGANSVIKTRERFNWYHNLDALGFNSVLGTETMWSPATPDTSLYESRQLLLKNVRWKDWGHKPVNIKKVKKRLLNDVVLSCLSLPYLLLPPPPLLVPAQSCVQLCFEPVWGNQSRLKLLCQTKQQQENNCDFQWQFYVSLNQWNCSTSLTTLREKVTEYLWSTMGKRKKLKTISPTPACLLPNW